MLPFRCEVEQDPAMQLPGLSVGEGVGRDDEPVYEISILLLSGDFWKINFFFLYFPFSVKIVSSRSLKSLLKLESN